MGDFSIGTMSTEAVDRLEAKVPGRLAQPKHGPHQRPGIISNLLNEPSRFFPALPTRNLGSCAGVFFPPPLRTLFQIRLGIILFVICLLIASRAAFRSAVSQLGISEGRAPCVLR